MPSPVAEHKPLSELSRAIQLTIRNAATFLLLDENRIYLYGDWPGLPVLLSHLRDEAGHALGMHPLGLPTELPPHPVAEMTNFELGKMGSAVDALLGDDTRPAMDAELLAGLEELSQALQYEKARRQQEQPS